MPTCACSAGPPAAGLGWRPSQSLLDGQVELLGHRLQAVRLLVDRVVEGFGGVGELAHRGLTLELVLDLGAHFGERALLAGLDPGDADDVVTEVGFHDVGDFPLLERKDGVLEGLDHHAAPEETEVAAFLRATRILRILARQVGKLGRRLAHFGEHLGGLGLRLVVILVGGNQDVAGAPLLRLLVAILMRLVPRLDLGLADRRLRQQAVEREHHVLCLDLLGNLELGGILIVELLHGLSIDLDLVGVLVGRKPQLGKTPLLSLDAQQGLGLGVADDRPLADHAEQLLQREILAQLGFELLLRHALRTQHGLVARERELAILLERRDGGNNLGQRRISYLQVAFIGLDHEQALIDQRVEHRVPHSRRIHHLGLEGGAKRLAHLVLALAQRLLELLHGNLGAAHAGHVVPDPGIAHIGIDAEEGEGERNQTQENLNDTFIVAYGVEHDRCLRAVLVFEGTKKANLDSPGARGMVGKACPTRPESL